MGDLEKEKVSLFRETMEILKKYGIRLNRRLGQNLLIDDSQRQKIINFADLSSRDTVLEIGPGIGTLTIPMAFNARKVVSIEQDPRMARILEKRISECGLGNVEIISGDALKIDFPHFNKIVSNLPYQISSPITFKFLDYDFDLGVLMYQREFAKRMNAPVGSRDYSRLTVMLYFRAKIQILDKISPQAFFPKPEIESALVKMVRKKETIVDDLFTDVCRALFQHRRKKARKALKESYHEINDLSKNKIEKVLIELPEDLGNERVFKLTPEQILEISVFIKGFT